MIKHILSLITLITCLGTLNAQLAIDFTETDINGNEHNLFSYLEEGKTVVLDVSATWCGPCWSLHQSHKLEYLNQAFGPDGTDEIVVIYFEGDSDTGSDELHGISGNTLGDWVSGTSYIIIDPTEVSDAFLDVYAPLGFPTVSVICPESKEIVADIYNSSYTEMVTEIEKCITLSEDPELTITSIKTGYSDCAIANYGATIRNIGKGESSNFVLTASKDGAEIANQNVSDVLALDQEFTIDLGSLGLTEDLTNLDFVIEYYDANQNNNAKSVEVSKPIETSNIISIYIEGDDYSTQENTSFALYSVDGTVVSEKVVIETGAVLELDLELDLGCYYVELLDDYGDGTLGGLLIQDSEGTIISDVSNWGLASTIYFNSSSISTSLEEVTSSYQVSLVSNLVHNDLVLEMFNLGGESVDISIYDLIGNVKYNENMKTVDQLTKQINVTDLADGMYILSTIINGEMENYSFVKN